MYKQAVSASQGYALFLEEIKIPAKMDGEKEIAELLAYAKSQPKGDWQAYAGCKRKLSDLHISCEQYQDTHQALIRILNV